MSTVSSHFDSIRLPIPSNTNPAEFLLDIVSSDFTGDQGQVDAIKSAWIQSPARTALAQQIEGMEPKDNGKVFMDEIGRPNIFLVTMSLLHRLFIKSYRDVVAYGIRIVMYLGMSWLLFLSTDGRDADITQDWL